MSKKVLQFLSSLKLTVVLLALAIAVVFFGTLGQTSDGLYVAQERYFRSWFTYWTPHGSSFPWVPLPGGYLVGSLLLLNLIVAHVTRFKWGWDKSGIFMTHVGIILLLVGQLLTDMMARESVMSFREGDSRNYSESSMDFEFALLTDAGSNTLDQVVAFPGSMVKPGAELAHELLPFRLRVREAWENAEIRLRAPVMDSNRPPASTQGTGARAVIEPRPVMRTMDDRNVPAAVVEILEGANSLGTWAASGGLRTQAFQSGGREWRLEYRPVREYKPFALTLLKTTHEVYPGTDLPKNFQSRVRIQNADAREDREVDIYMNNPLRYGGYTFFQYQMGREQLNQGGRGTSALQVVQNPSWLAPYLGCVIVGLGLLVQFGIHLGKFLTRRPAPRPVAA
jgi:hypothetical protein